MNKKLLIGLGVVGVGTAVSVPLAVVLTKHDGGSNNGSNIDPKTSVHNKTGHKANSIDWKELTKATKVAVELTKEEEARIKAQLDGDIKTITDFEEKAFEDQKELKKQFILN